MCEILRGKPWTLLGSCEMNAHNRKFIAQLYPNMRFQGFGDYVIEKMNDTWSWRDTLANETLALMAVNLYDYPIGLNSWMIKTSICGQVSGYRQLLLSSCDHGQFSCSDATCIPHEYRCDLKFDCNDHSDEDNCKIVVLPKNYKVILTLF